MLFALFSTSLVISALDPTCEDVVRNNRGFYDQIAKDYSVTHAHISPSVQRQREIFVQQARNVTGAMTWSGEQHKMRTPRPIILDLGSDHGRDSAYFRAQGLDVYALDVSFEMVKISSQYLERPAFHLTAEEMNFDQDFHAIWASASLIHIPIASLEDFFRRIARALKRGGIFMGSFTKRIGTPDLGEFIPEGRYFSRVSEAKLREIVGRIPELEILEALTFTNDDDDHGANKPNSEFGFFHLAVKKRATP